MTVDETRDGERETRRIVAEIDPRFDTTEATTYASPTRRTVLKAGAALTLGAAGLSALGPRSVTAAPPSQLLVSPVACVLTPEVTEGPYYVPGELIRRDLTEGKPGVPLRLRINVVDAATCAPLPDAAVDLWHCDAHGYYSAVSGEYPGGGGEPSTDENLTTTFLRGIQLTDAAGSPSLSRSTLVGTSHGPCTFT